ncbi:MAG: hypothetical protein V3R93_03505 [Candidatus Hydrothermarchaeaceae archaeon]
MELTNADRWLLVLRDGDVTFDDIKAAINQTSESKKFDYDTGKGKHAIFHRILDDLDTLCRNGDAQRTFEKENETEIMERFRITPQGRARAEKLLLISSGHRR